MTDFAIYKHFILRASMTETPIYSAGNIIPVNEATVCECLRKAEEVLGLPHQEHKPEIIYVTADISRLFDIKGAYGNGKVTLPRRAGEKTVFHEGVHYLMDSAGLFFPTSPERFNLFYDKFVNETVAEFAAEEVYGHGTRDVSDGMLFSITQDEIDRDVDSVAQEREMTGAEKTAYRKRYEELAVWGVSMINQQLYIDRKYLETEDTDAIMPLVKYLYEYVSSPECAPGINLAAKQMALRNASKLHGQGFTPKELVAWIGDAVRNDWDSFGIYFWDIVRAGAGR